MPFAVDPAAIRGSSASITTYAGRRGPPDAALAETAAICSADFLRMFAGAGVDGLLLDEGRVPAGELIHPEAYRPALNVADYYDLVLAPVPADADPEAVMTQVRALV